MVLKELKNNIARRWARYTDAFSTKVLPSVPVKMKGITIEAMEEITDGGYYASGFIEGAPCTIGTYNDYFVFANKKAQLSPDKKYASFGREEITGNLKLQKIEVEDFITEERMNTSYENDTTGNKIAIVITGCYNRSGKMWSTGENVNDSFTRLIETTYNVYYHISENQENGEDLLALVKDLGYSKMGLLLENINDDPLKENQTGNYPNKFVGLTHVGYKGSRIFLGFGYSVTNKVSIRDVVIKDIVSPTTDTKFKVDSIEVGQ